ncbi:sphingosine-1-phosphate phosphatase [Mycena floridula]|nr:sphingosine-1-phosphate phosphatase [Mycena floridula]
MTMDEVPRAAHFTVSVASSRTSSPFPSRSSSPAPKISGTNGSVYLTKASTDGFLKPTSDPKRRGADVYDTLLPWWRASVRRSLVKNLSWESRVIARMQDRIRTPALDAYFVYTSSLGTHTFFMIFLPAIFFFGWHEFGHGLVMVLALGVYFSSYLKDLYCSPRPFAPPVTRLTIGTHHLEYGFPSTHSTSCMSMAAYIWGHVYSLRYPENGFESEMSHTTFVLASIGLGWYAFSIVFGRLYAAMHSFSDCAMGVLLGGGLWWAYGSFAGIPVYEGKFMLLKGLELGRILDDWVATPVLSRPLILISVVLLLINQHPVPVDDCPCFEDAIAFNGVALGTLLGHWGHAMQSAYHPSSSSIDTLMPGSPYTFDVSLGWIPVERGWKDIMIWSAFALLKMVFGILVIFAWRLAAKSLSHLVLPPTYRFFARAIQLPNRRFYTPATDYKNVPSEFNTDGLGALRAVPSVIDLPGTGGVGEEVGGIGSGTKSFDGGLKLRKSLHSKPPSEASADEKDGDPERVVRHYDADVLTKLIVYAGIAALATEGLPTFFDAVGWGVKSWPRPS